MTQIGEPGYDPMNDPAGDDDWPMPETGLLTGYTGTVTDAWFAPNERFAGWQLMLKQTTDSALHPEWTEQLRVGEQWESFDGGQTIENKDNPEKKNVHMNSRYGEFQTRMIECGVTPQQLRAKGTPREAKTWVGFVITWGEVSKDYSMEREGKQVEGKSRYNMPVAVQAESGATIFTNAPVQSTGQSSALDGVSEELATALREARAASSSHSEFVDKAIGLTGVVGNDTLVRAIADENGLWKELS